jgi:hypothetical protein
METDILLLLGRILFGGFFVFNGLNHLFKHGAITGYAASKNVPQAGLAVTLSGLMILFGGLGVLLGAYINLAVLFLVVLGRGRPDSEDVGDGQFHQKSRPPRRGADASVHPPTLALELGVLETSTYTWYIHPGHEIPYPSSQKQIWLRCSRAGFAWLPQSREDKE